MSHRTDLLAIEVKWFAQGHEEVSARFWTYKSYTFAMRSHVPTYLNQCRAFYPNVSSCFKLFLFHALYIVSRAFFGIGECAWAMWPPLTWELSVIFSPVVLVIEPPHPKEEARIYLREPRSWKLKSMEVRHRNSFCERQKNVELNNPSIPIQFISAKVKWFTLFYG
jgi:hypothetical protein